MFITVNANERVPAYNSLSLSALMSEADHVNLLVYNMDMLQRYIMTRRATVKQR